MIVSTSPPTSLISRLRAGGVHLTGFKLVSLFIPLIDNLHLLNSAFSPLVFYNNGGITRLEGTDSIENWTECVLYYFALYSIVYKF